MLVYEIYHGRILNGRMIRLKTFGNILTVANLEKFLSKSITFHIKSKATKMLSCKNFATLIDPPLINHFSGLC